MRLIKGISHEQVRGIEQARRDEPFRSVFDLAHRSGAAKPTLARLAAADAMQSLGLNRREALWQVLALSNEPPLLEGLSPADDQPTLPPETLRETVIQDYQTLGLSLNAHPMSLIRKELARMRVQPARALQHARQGQYMKVAGIVLIRQRPGSALGVMFFTLEDETGVANLVIRPPVYERFRVAARAAVALIAEGRVTRESEVVHMQVSALHDVRTLLDELRSVSRDYR